MEGHGVPWYSVMGCLVDALEMSCNCHTDAFIVSLGALGGLRGAMGDLGGAIEVLGGFWNIYWVKNKTKWLHFCMEI